MISMKGSVQVNYVDRSGIYLFTNKDTNAQYVGLAQDLSNRLSDYYSNSYLERQRDRGSYISRALLKHGFDNFYLTILEYCPINELSIREQYY